MAIKMTDAEMKKVIDNMMEIAHKIMEEDSKLLKELSHR